MYCNPVDILLCVFNNYSWKTTNHPLRFLGMGKQRRTVTKFMQSVPSMRIDGLNHDFVFLSFRVPRLSVKQA